MEKTKLGLTQNVEGALAYILGPLTGIIFLIAERNNKFISFHALQSIILFSLLYIVEWAISYIPIINWMPIGLIILLIKIYLMYMAYKEAYFKVPIIGEAVFEHINK